MDTIELTQQCPTAIYIPNVFSPDSESGDENTLFGLYGEDVISMELSVYDRWGNKLFTTTDQDLKWQGMANGKRVNQGTYSWILNLEGYNEDGTTFMKTMEGTFLLVR